MTRVIVHPGFHKTGTTTVQMQLAEARGGWQGRWIVGLRDDMPGVSHNARLFSQSRRGLDLGLMQNALADWFEAQPLAGIEGVVVSCEDFAGFMPGRCGAIDYSAAPQLMLAFAEVVTAVFGPELDLRFFFSTREMADWLPSVHWQNVRTGTLAESWAQFRARVEGGVNLDTVVERVAAVLAPWPVQAMRLEESRTLAQGPITPILDLMGIPQAERAAFTPEDRRNARPEHHNIRGLADRFAQINAQFGDVATAARRKRAVLARHAAQSREERNE